MRWVSLLSLLTACADPAAPPPTAPLTRAPTLKPEPVVTARTLDAEPLPSIAPGDGCPTLGLWERPLSPCIVEADSTDRPWRARIEAPQLRFELNTGEMDPASLKVIDTVAALLTKHPELEQIEVHAHTDSKASHHY